MAVKKERVLVGMSGGVDSSVAAYLLTQEGYDVIGVTAKVWPQDCISRAEDKCCGPQAIADARAVAHSLGVPHYVVDEVDDFNREVVDYFADEYRAGRTPNPCVVCNEKLKFGKLREKAQALDCSYIATGHYASLERTPERVILRRGKDPDKDQSYFLFSLSQEQLAGALFPLGDRSKGEIRAIARSLGLKVADKVESQEICFVPDHDYVGFLKTHLGEQSFQSGGIYDMKGNFLGDHGGIEMYTVGQRKGLPGGAPRPRYVVDIDPVGKRVIVGYAEHLLTGAFEVDRVNWVGLTEPSGPIEASVKIRYNHPGTDATVHPLEDRRARVTLHEPQQAVAPGQAAVFYQGQTVAGGGWISRQAAFATSETRNTAESPA